MKKAVSFYLFCILLILLSSCSTFIKEEQVESVMKREAYLYETLIDVKYEEQVVLKKGTEVQIYFVASKNYLKVYAFPNDKGYLASEHYLILYLFGDDFESEIFEEDKFYPMLDEVVQRKRELTAEERERR
ncbi:MAG: hypothetical protein JXR90_13160 [Spirochaetes bacterium]|nr:hypothetical protein [Spirochaetota bacterium]